MRLSVESILAWRYLVGKKSHAAVNAIAGVSVVGMAIATAAIVCVLSVFNGFRDVLSQTAGPLLPDLLVTPAKGKAFASGDSIAGELNQIEGVLRADPVVSDQALIIYQSQEMPVILRGVPRDMPTLKVLQDKIVTTPKKGLGERPDSEFIETAYGSVERRDAADALVSVGVALRMSLYDTGDVLTLFAPKREGRLNQANPAASFVVDSVRNVGVYQTDRSESDRNTIVTDLETAREVLQYTDEATAFELTLSPRANPDEIADHIKKILPDAAVNDRVSQQEVNARMIDIEKWVTFLLLFFILVIASFNVISTMSMLVIEKQSVLKLLSSLGLPAKRISGIFARESAYVTIIGAVSGTILGVLLVLSQKWFGWIKIQGDPTQLLTTSYPVRLEASDILITLIPLFLIGVFCAISASLFARSKMRSFNA